MPYIVPYNLAEKLKNIRISYMSVVPIELDTALQPWAISCFFGSTNVLARKNQITLIETIYKTQLSQFFDAEGQLILNSTSPQEEINAYFDGMRILIAVLFFIKSEISALYWLRSATHSKLFNLIDEALALPEGNIIDEATRNCALSTTEEFIKRTTAPKVLDKDLIALNDEPDWKKFKEFIAKQCADLRIEPNHYPITQFLMPIVGKPFELAGYAVGWTLGEFISRSAYTQRNRLSLTDGVGNLLSLACGGGVMGMGVGFVAPTVAERLFEHYSEITLAWLLGATMNLIGQGAGALVGLPLDATRWAACYAIASLHDTNGKPLPPISGFNLVNGDCYDKGTPLLTMEENHKIEQIALQIYNSTKIESTDEAIEIEVVNAPPGNTAIIPRDPRNLSNNQKSVIQELKTVLEERGLLPTDKLKINVEEAALHEVSENSSDPRLTCTPSALAL